MSDKMLTLKYPMAYEYENEEFEKIKKVTEEPLIYCLSAGVAVFASEIIETAKNQASNKKGLTVKSVAEIVCKAYTEYRKSRLVRNELLTRGLDLNSYYANHKGLLGSIVETIDKTFRMWNLGVEFIVAGRDSSGYHIYTIVHPGDLYCQDSIGYSTIGIGAPHATYHMIENKYRISSDKDIVVKLVKDAKKRSEVAPGVGAKTESIVLPVGE
jgi:20S proteasome alpha/beta subunit